VLRHFRESTGLKVYVRCCVRPSPAEGVHRALPFLYRTLARFYAQFIPPGENSVAKNYGPSNA
jgi:hypothetical protein